MILQNLLLILPSSILATFTKFLKTNLDEQTSKYISNNGLYHFTKNIDTANQIIQSGRINPTKGILASYGLPAAFMFAGIPNLDNYIKNIGFDVWNNVLLHPEQVLIAVKINPKEEDLKNYKMRLQDGAIAAEGGCEISGDKVEIKQMVIDYIPDENGKKVLKLRERTKEEIEQDTDLIMMGNQEVNVPGARFHKYRPSIECMEAIKEERRKLGYIPSLDLVSTTSHVLDIETKESIGVVKNFVNKLKNLLNFKNKKLALPKPKLGVLSEDIKGRLSLENKNNLSRFLETLNKISVGNIKKKIPNLDVKYRRFVSKIKQRDSLEVIEELINGSFFQYAKQYDSSIEQKQLLDNDKSNIERCRRIALLSSEILQSTGISFDEKMFNTMLSANYFLNLKDQTDKKEDIDLLNIMSQLLIKKNSKSDSTLEQYSISKEEKEKLKFYSSVLKDANLLSRIGESEGLLMKENPNFLLLYKSKELVNFSFDFNLICKNISVEQIMKIDTAEKLKKSYMESLKVKNSPTISKVRKIESQNLELNRASEEIEISE